MKISYYLLKCGQKKWIGSAFKGIDLKYIYMYIQDNLMSGFSINNYFSMMPKGIRGKISDTGYCTQVKIMWHHVPRSASLMGTGDRILWQSILSCQTR